MGSPVKWIVIGSGPTGHGHPHAVTELPDVPVVVVNTAIHRVPWDLVDYWMFKEAARKNDDGTRLFEPSLFQKAKDAGITMLTFCYPNCLETPREVWMDGVEFLKAGQRWSRGGYNQAYDPQGPRAVEYAVNHGATEIEVYGFEGLPFDRTLAQTYAEKQMCQLQQHDLQTVIDGCPDIRFMVHGDLWYELSGENVELTHGDHAQVR